MSKPGKAKPSPSAEFQQAKAALGKLAQAKAASVPVPSGPSGGEAGFITSAQVPNPNATPASVLGESEMMKKELPQPPVASVEASMKLEIARAGSKLLWSVAGLAFLSILAVWAIVDNGASTARDDINNLRNESNARIERIEVRIDALDDRLRTLEQRYPTRPFR